MLTRRNVMLGAAFAQALKRPNILLLFADNWAYPHASAYGDPVVRTPVFDRIAREGTLFTHAFGANPSCAPSRASLLTGQPTHLLGEAASLYGPLSARYPVYPDLLERAGYRVGFTGKGWGPGKFEGGGRERNPAGASFSSLEAFLDKTDASKPFCFWVGSHDPHVPWNRGRERRARMDASKVRVPAHLPDCEAAREDILGYYCEVEEFDTECGVLLDGLARRGLLDNTLVVVTADNGWQMPRGLANCYDLGVRVPMAVRLPDRVRAGAVSDAFVTLTDLFPTFLETAALNPPKTHARSLWPLLEGKAQPERDHVFLERERHANVRRGDLSYPVRGVRTREFLYLRNLAPDRHPAGDPELYWAVGPYGDVDGSRTKTALLDPKRPAAWNRQFDLVFGKRPAEELYDLKADPDQTANVAAHPKYAAVKKRLAAQVDAWMRDTGDPRSRGWTDYWDKAPYSGPPAKDEPANRP